jgi:hypothetical protein
VIDGIAPHVIQAIFEDASIRFGIPDVGSYASPSFADINGDGLSDLVIGSGNGTIQILANNGNSTNPDFSGSPLDLGLPSVPNNANPFFADINDDGKLDLFIGSGDGNIYYFENTGSTTSPAFAASSTRLNLPKVEYFAKAALADIDADGDLDLFIGSGDAITYFYLNTGEASSAAFAGSTIGFGLPDVGTFAAPAFGDFDGDGDLDLFIGNYDGNTLFFENVGNATSAAFAEANTNVVATKTKYRSNPTLVDINGDGNLDLFISDYYGNTQFLDHTGRDVIGTNNTSGSYGIGSVITITVPFSEIVTVTGTPTLRLETGSTDQVATYSSGSGTNTLTFTYTVQAGDTSSDLDYTSSAALELNGGAIQDAAGNDANISLAEPGTSGSLALNGALVIDGIAVPDATTDLDLDEYSETGYSYTDNITSITTPTIRGTAEAGSTVDLYDSDGTTSLGSTTADENGNWSIATSTLSAGIHRLTAKAKAPKPPNANGNALITACLSFRQHWVKPKGFLPPPQAPCLWPIWHGAVIYVAA